MGMTFLNRRAVIAGIGALAFAPRTAFAKDVIDLKWSDLVPEGDTFVPPILRGIVEHDQSNLMADQPVSSGIRTDWNGRTVRLPGFIVPIDYSGTGVTAFILVPFVGACVHVPPPPANQLVFVTTETPFESTGLFEAVTVTGLFGTASTRTQIAEVGYALSADRIESY